MLKKCLFSLVCLVVVTSAPASAMELSEGFLGYHWGQDITKNDAFKLKHSGGIIDYYVNTEQNYNISDVDSAYVVFGAIGGQLYAVFVGIETEQGYERAKDYLLSRFGNPKVKRQGQVLEYSWLKYDFKVRIKLKKDQQDGSMKMAFYYLPVAGAGGPEVPESLQEMPTYSWTEKPGAPKAIPLLRF